MPSASCSRVRSPSFRSWTTCAPHRAEVANQSFPAARTDLNNGVPAGAAAVSRTEASVGVVAAYTERGYSISSKIIITRNMIPCYTVGRPRDGVSDDQEAVSHRSRLPSGLQGHL